MAWRAGEAETVLAMSRLRMWFAAPRDGDARETLRWVRRMEIGVGVLGLVAAATTWSGEWWSCRGSSSVEASRASPRGREPRRSCAKAETRPEILITDPVRRKERGRRFLRYFLPIYVLIFAGIGYLLLGVGGGIFFFAVAAIGGGLGAWMVWKMEP